ncbi:hypothetical protein PtB15_4B301 [Puccinia triticina]|nr:hypothetical protein PtB15_4B301 [Puccinia triticina]
MKNVGAFMTAGVRGSALASRRKPWQVLLGGVSASPPPSKNLHLHPPNQPTNALRSYPSYSSGKMSDNEQSQQPEHINIKVVDRNSQEVFFKIKTTTKLGKLMDVYANRIGHDPTTIRFIFDGVKVKPDDTPLDLDMSDNDRIDVMVEQVGGANFKLASLRDCRPFPHILP